MSGSCGVLGVYYNIRIAEPGIDHNYWPHYSYYVLSSLLGNLHTHNVMQCHYNNYNIISVKCEAAAVSKYMLYRSVSQLVIVWCTMAETIAGYMYTHTGMMSMYNYTSSLTCLEPQFPPLLATL